MADSIVYVKEDLSNPKVEAYYFTDGMNLVPQNFTFKGTVAKIKFLKSIGITVNHDTVDVDFDCYV